MVWCRACSNNDRRVFPWCTRTPVSSFHNGACPNCILGGCQCEDVPDSEEDVDLDLEDDNLSDDEDVNMQDLQWDPDVSDDEEEWVGFDN